MNNLSINTETMEYFDMKKCAIEKELSELKKIVDHINEMRGNFCFASATYLLILNIKKL